MCGGGSCDGRELPRRGHVALTALMVVMWLLDSRHDDGATLGAIAGATLSWITMPWMALVGLCFVDERRDCTSRDDASTRAATKREVDLSRRRFLAA